MEPLPTSDLGQIGDDGLSGWLAEVEGRLTAIDARLASLESSLRPTIAEEVHGATAELRRAITELGRRLVTDLPHELARHRDAIVTELRPPSPAPPPPEPAPPAEAEVDVDQVGEPEPDEDFDGAPTAEVAGRRRRRRRP